MEKEFSKEISETYSQDSYLKDLQRRASIDTLSGLLNRYSTERFIKERLKEMTQEETCALFIVDLDDFKQVNDILGHPAGDQAIRQAAGLLSSLFRANDIVGRLGGDEFAVFLHGQITEDLVFKKASAICEKLQMVLGDYETVTITASVGVYLAAKGQEFEGLYQAADLALYKAKKAGKHRFCLKNQDRTQSNKVRSTNVITLSSLLQSMESGVALLELGEIPQIIYISPSFCRLIGVDADYFSLPKPLSDLVHPDDIVSVLNVLRSGIEQEKVVEFTHRIRANKNQDWSWWQIKAAQIEYDSSNPVMMVTTIDVSKFKEEQQKQKKQIQRFQTAINLTAKRIWEVDLSTRIFRGDIQDETNNSSLFPDNLIESGQIHPSSVNRFRLFAKELLNGSAQGFGNFAIRQKDSNYYGWFSLSYRMIFNETGRAIQAIGVIEDLPRSFTGGEDWSPDQYRLPGRLVADLVMRMRANLDLDTIESLWIEGSDLSNQVQETLCSEILKMEKQNIFCKGDQQDFLANFDRDALLKLYHSGQRWLCAEYRRATRSGSIRWVRHILYLKKEPISQHIYLFVYLLWLDPEHRFEQLIYKDASRDAVSRLYDRTSIQRLAELMFTDRKSGNRAVAVLQVYGLEKQPPIAATDQLLYGIAASLSLVLGGGCLLGQYSPYQFIIVFPDVTEKDELRHHMDESMAALRRMLASELAYQALRFVMGIDLMPAATANYRSMLAQAIQVCSLRWSSAVDTVDFTQEQEEWNWRQLQTDDPQQISVHTTEMVRPLSDREKDLALDSVSAMLAAKTLNASMLGVLRAIGEYYHADRVYSLMLVENRDAVIMTFEWTNGSKRSIQQVVSGIPLEKFPLLLQCMRERAPVFLSRQTYAEPENGKLVERPWHFTVFPLMHDPNQEILGFLCIENAQKHPADAAVFGTLIPFILQQRERFNTKEHPSAITELLANIPDLRTYTEILHTLNSDYYSSMGAICLDIPGLASKATENISKYENQILSHAANTLTEVFGSALLFRTRDAEFLAFYPNTTREVFLSCCSRLWSMLQQRYPKQMRIGQAWANGIFTGQHLAEEAKAVMENQHSELFAGDSSILLNMLYSPTFKNIVKNAQFIIYFQPKINVQTGTLAGAEALVRKVKEDGSIIVPSQFIPFLEETSAIRDLDLFVLEQSLSQMEQWRLSGLGIIPVAVNLSRTTLAHPATLASILAIQSRYPDIPESALELEITERGDGINTLELQNLVNRFRACGLHMSLDDFGSQYANLSLFANVKFETVKLDRSLISGLEHNPISRTLVQDLIRICQTYGMTCVAEGVETEKQISVLREIGCIYVQGFYYDRPLPADEFRRKYLQENKPTKKG